MNDSSNPDLPEEQLPQEVVAALKERYGPQTRIPETLDKTILRDAAGHLRTISPATAVRPVRRRKTWIAVSTGSLAAAMLLFVMWPGAEQHEAVLAPNSVSIGRSAQMETADAVTLSSEDVDQNGTVNILDAFALARTIDSNRAGITQWDLNGDGLTNRDDVNLIAMRAVTL